MGYENALFSYGGELGDYSTYKVDGIVNSPEAVAALEAYKELYKFTPPNWGQAFFLEDNQAITEGLAAMSMNYFAFFPALANKATNPYADVTGFFANPAGPSGKQHAALGGQGISIVSYSKKQDEVDEVPRVVHQRGRTEEVGRARRLHLQCQGAGVAEFRNATPYNEAFYQIDVHGEGLLGGARICASCLTQMNNRIGPFIVGEQGTAKEALDGVAQDWRATFKKYGR